MIHLPEPLLDAIWDHAQGDHAEADRSAQRCQRVLPEMAAAGERIRAQVRESRCRCELSPEFVTADGRCGRCFGRREVRCEGPSLN